MVLKLIKALRLNPSTWVEDEVEEVEDDSKVTTRTVVKQVNVKGRERKNAPTVETEAEVEIEVPIETAHAMHNVKP
jgi:hypothetical protein